MDTVVDGQRYREPLHTTDWREAKEREKERLTELARRPADPTRRGQSYGALDVSKAIEAYAKERRAQVSPRMVAYWTENAKPLSGFFGTTTLRNITPEQVDPLERPRMRQVPGIVRRSSYGTLRAKYMLRRRRVTTLADVSRHACLVDRRPLATQIA